MFYDIPIESQAVKLEIKEIYTPNTKYNIGYFAGLKTMYCKVTFKLPRDISLQELDEVQNLSSNSSNNFAGIRKRKKVPEYNCYFTLVNYNQILSKEIKDIEENKYYIRHLFTRTIKEIPMKNKMTIDKLESIIYKFDHNEVYGQYYLYRYQMKQQFPFIQLHQSSSFFLNVSPYFCMYIQQNLEEDTYDNNNIEESLLIHNEKQYIDLGTRLLGLSTGIATYFILKNERWYSILYGLLVSSTLCCELGGAISRIYLKKSQKFISQLKDQQRHIANNNNNNNLQQTSQPREENFYNYD